MLAGIAIACMVVAIAGAVSPTLTLVGVAGLCLAATMVVYPGFGMAVLIAFFLLQQSPVYQEYGVLTSRAATLSDLGGLLVLVGVLREQVWRRDDPLILLKGSGWLVVMSVCTFFWFGLVTVLWSSASSAQLDQFIRLQLEAPIILVLGLVTLRTWDRVRWSMAAYALTGLALSIYVIANFAALSGFSIGSYYAREHAFRGGNIGYGQNELGVILAVVPLMAFAATERFAWPVRWAASILTIPSVVVALLVLSSRGSIISLGVGLVGALLLSKGARAKAAVLGLLAVGAASFGVILAAGNVPTYVQQRFQSIGTDQIGGRGPVWTRALSLFAGNPLGLGAMSFEHLLPSAYVTLYAGVTAVNDDFIGTVVDYGVVGGVLLLVMLCVLAWTVFRDGDRDPALIAVFVVLVASMVTGDRLAVHSYWATMTLVVCAALTADWVRVRPKARTFSEMTRAASVTPP